MNTKQYKNFETEDFLADEEFRRWVLRKDDQLDYFWKKWVLLHPEKEKSLLKARELLLSMKFGTVNVDAEEKDQTLGYILKGERSKHYTADKPSRDRNIENTGLWLKIAATIMLLLAFSALFFLLKEDVGEKEVIVQKANTITKENPKGQKLTFMLPDGSKVILNAESRITFSENFEQNSRNVYLEGEAYFEVVSDQTRLFTVKTGRISTNVLGTTFNVKAFPETKTVAVSLLEGKVKVLSDDVVGNTSEFMLDPGEKVSIDNETSQAKKSLFDVTEDFGWKDGIIVFNGDNFASVKAKLERWYGVEIRTLNSPGSMEIKGRFDNLSLEDVLENLSYTNHIEYSIVNKVVTVKFNKK